MLFSTPPRNLINILASLKATQRTLVSLEGISAYFSGVICKWANINWTNFGVLSGSSLSTTVFLYATMLHIGIDEARSQSDCENHGRGNSETRESNGGREIEKVTE